MNIRLYNARILTMEPGREVFYGEVWVKRTFQNCRFYRSGDVLFADMEVFNGQGNDTERY